MEKMQPEQVMAILREHGMEITVEFAEQILEYYYTMADIAVAQILREEKEEIKLPDKTIQYP